MKTKRIKKNKISIKEELIIKRQISSERGMQGAGTNSSQDKAIYSKTHIRIPQLREAPQYPVYKREIIIRDCNLQKNNSDIVDGE